MSMVINLVEDHNIYLCEGGPVYNGGVQPTPITYLTQWKIVGNSQVHTDPYLTSWKVSGNSVVDNNTILSCGDLGQDGKYHVKISNGVTIYDIPLDAPLRKVGDVADTIEFPSNANGKALVTRPFRSINLGSLTYTQGATTGEPDRYRYFSSVISDIKNPSSSSVPANVLCPKYSAQAGISIARQNVGISVNSGTDKRISIYDATYNAANQGNELKLSLQGVELIYELVTPTTELVDAPQIAVSPTDTYISANATPYSAFEHTENKEIWSCGEYNATDGKYHILVQPQGGSIADIALDEPLRKVNDVADSIEFPSGTEGKALVTRPLKTLDLGSITPDETGTSRQNEFKWRYKTLGIKKIDNATKGNILCAIFPTTNGNGTYSVHKTGISNALNNADAIIIFDEEYCSSGQAATFQAARNGVEVIYELATPTTELVDAPQIQEAENYSCVISQGVKAVEWSSFETE